MGKMRQQTYSQFSQSEAFLCLGLFDKTNLQIVPEMYFKLYKSVYKLQVLLQVKFYYKFNLQLNLQVQLQVFL